MIIMPDKWRVLIAEDDDDWLLLAKDQLSENEYSVTVARSTAEVDTLIRQKREFDIAIVDLGLGGYRNFNMQSGLDVAALLIKETGAKVGLYSAITNEEAKRKARELGVPLFNKAEIHGFDNMVNETLYHKGMQGRQEKHY